MQKGSVAFYTLGCKLNYSETSTLGRMILEEGYVIKPFHQPADIYVINTCSVTDNADKKCKKVVKQALKNAPGAYIIVVGCYAQLKPEEISSIEGVDLVLGAAEKFNITKYITSITEEDRKLKKKRYFVGDIAEVQTFKSAYSFGERTRTFLKVQDGCDYSCSFCTIPLARGQSRSNTIANVLENIKKIAAQGVSEIVLTGVNIGDFGKNNGTEKTETFLELVNNLEQTQDIKRFRISSIEPNLLTNEIIEFVAGSEKFVPHFHIPLQSGNKKILKLMRRRYLRELYSDRVNYIKSLMPSCCIGVDVITGFPGETAEDFLDTYQFLIQLDISYLHVFTYSERADTLAVSMENVVPQKIREERTRQLRNLSDKKKRYFYEQFVGTQRPVLFEEETDGEFMYGFTDNYIKVKTLYDPLLVNEIVDVKLLAVNAAGDMEAEEILEKTSILA